MILYPGKSIYTGELKNEKPHGQGTFIFSDGSKHYGEWKKESKFLQSIEMLTAIKLSFRLNALYFQKLKNLLK